MVQFSLLELKMSQNMITILKICKSFKSSMFHGFLTMLNRAFHLSSSRKFFNKECERIEKTFVRLRYPITLLENIITRFITQQRKKDDHPTVEERNIKEDVVHVMLPFKDQKSADCETATA